MSTYKSEDGKSFFEIENTGFHNANGSESYSFGFDVKSHKFSGRLNDVWFYKDDLTNFIKAVGYLTSGKEIKAYLNAMSDFILVVTPIDSIGHFAVKFNLSDAINENSASLTVMMETQSLMEFAAELQKSLNG